MASTIKVKRSSTASAVPASLAEGELAANTTDGKLFLGKADTSVVQIGGLDPTGDSMSGDLNMQDNQIIRPKIKDYSMVVNAMGSQSSFSYTLSTMVAGDTFSVASQQTGPRGCEVSQDGTKIYVVGTTPDSVHQYTLSTAFDLSTASYASKTLDCSGQDSNLSGMCFSTNGTRLYVWGGASAAMYQYNLSTAWDLSTASYASKSYDPAELYSAYSMRFSGDGTKLYLGAGDATTIFQYTLSTAWELNTASYASKSYNTAGYVVGLIFRNSGAKMLILEGATVKQYSLSTAWDVSTASYDSVSLSVSATASGPRGLSQGSTEEKLFFSGGTTNNILFNYDGIASAAARTIDLENGNYVTMTNASGLTLTFSNPPANGSAGSFVLEITNGGAYTVTWPTSVDWAGGTAPTLTAAGKDLLVFTTQDGGTTWHGIVSSLDSK